MEYKSSNYTVGLDIGITSVGFSIVDPDNDELVEFGVRHFEQATEAKDARRHRSSRRNLRRKKWRKDQLKAAFIDFGILSEEELATSNYLRFNANNDGLVEPKDKSPYHLRKRALEEKISKRELLICLYNIIQARGHFLLETVDFESESNAITFDLFKEKYYSIAEIYVDFASDRKEFEDKVLKPIFESKMGKGKDIDNAIKNLDHDICSEEDSLKLISITKLINGSKVDLAKIDEALVIPEKNSSQNVEGLKSEDDLCDFLANVVNLSDMIKIYKILKDYKYICEIDVKLFDEYSEKKKDNIKEKGARAIRNKDNTYPNGLYKKEARAILRKQKEFYGDDVISDEFIEVCLSIISARIPYFIGPLGDDAKNGWAIKNGNFKYSYEYSLKNGAVDVYGSIKKWKERMISHCTYLTDEAAMPKGSFVAETFSIANEINILKAIDANHNDYNLTYEDKVKVFDALFLNNNSVHFTDVAELLGLSSFSTRTGSMKRFNNAYTLYHKIAEILPELRLNTIEEIFTDKEKIQKIENIILDINLFDEEKSKKDYFSNPNSGYWFSDREDVVNKLSKLKSKGFYSLSSKFVMDYPLDKEGNSLLELLFNTPYEQMYLITNATDKMDKPIDLNANKYMDILKKDPNLSIDLLIDGDKPVIPVSRPVIRALNECLKLYSEIIKVYGVPKRLAIETAREFNEAGSPKKKATKPHKDKMKSLFDILMKQKNSKGNLNSDWSDIEHYLNVNRTKVELYIRQDGVDLITGEKIDISRLEDYDIDHILPAGFGDDSIDNKELIKFNVNREKNNRLPLEFIGSPEARRINVNTTDKEFIDRIKRLHEIKTADGERLISDKKLSLLMMRDSKDVEGFIEQNIVDTRYIIKEFISIINAYNKTNNFDTHIVSLKSMFTNLYRNGLGIKKNRDVGLQHHAIDATIIVIADACLNAIYPNYDQRQFRSNSYTKFMETVKGLTANGKNEDRDSLRRLVYYGFNKALNISPSRSKLLASMKFMTPLYSEKVLKNYRGQLFGDTIQKQSEFKGDSPLSMLGINNDKHVFTGVNSVAVDFYKVSYKRKNEIVREHIAIHIPKAIVKENGEINKEKYLMLIKDYYKKPILLDENGELRTEFFRFRAFKNDIIYDTNSYVPQRFILGSLAMRTLEAKHIDIHSYQEIYEAANMLVDDLKSEFKFRTSLKEDRNLPVFNELDRKEIIEFLISTRLNENENEAYGKYIRKDSALNDKNTNISTFAQRVIYVEKALEDPFTANSVLARNIIMANNNIIKRNPSAEYVKLKYNILGLRFNKNEKGKLIILGPKYNSKAFKRIKKEKFSWKLSQFGV